MRSLSLFPAVALVALLCACPTKMIPGTEIEDTSDTRAILDVMSKYREAVEHRNAQGIIELCDESFRDDGGSSVADDDLDYKTLFTVLPMRFQKLDDIRLDINIRKVEFDDLAAHAKVTYTYTTSFRMPQYTQKTHSETDIKQMYFTHVGDKVWKIVGGI